jgi:ATP-dependent DNA ligase
MEPKLISKLPKYAGWQYEPKWDGFRCLAFRAGDEVEIEAKSGKSLPRFFPEALEKGIAGVDYEVQEMNRQHFLSSPLPREPHQSLHPHPH